MIEIIISVVNLITAIITLTSAIIIYKNTK